MRTNQTNSSNPNSNEPHPATARPVGTLADVAANPSTIGTDTVDTGAIDTDTVDTDTIDNGTIDNGTIDNGTIDTGTIDTGATSTLDASAHQAVAPAPASRRWARRTGTVLLPLSLVLAACGSGSSEEAEGANQDPAPDSSAAMGDDDSMGDMSMDSDSMGEMEGHDGEHGDHEDTKSEVDWTPVPSISVEAVESDDGIAAVATLTDFTLDEDSVDGEPEDGVGHLHLYVDGEKMGRRFDETVELTDLSEGSHEVTLTLSANDHSLLTSDGELLEGTVTVEVSADQAAAIATPGGADEGDEHGDDDHGDGGHSGDGEQTDEAPDQIFEIEVADGERVAGDSDISASIGEVVEISVTSDVADELHVHGYDLLEDVDAGGTASITFLADIPGKFEVEFESDGFLLTSLEVS